MARYSYEGLEFNCTLVQSMKFSFFNTKMNPKTELDIVEHLINCPECMKIYKSYANAIGWGDFDIEAHYKKLLAKVKQEKSWVEYCTKDEAIKLARSKAIRQIMLGGETDKGFVDYLILQICKSLDHLEACYNVKEEVKNEKS